MGKLKCNAYVIDSGIIQANIFKNAIAGDDYAFDDQIGHGTGVTSIYAKNTDATIIVYNHSPNGVHNERLVFSALADIEKRVISAPGEFHLINTSFHDKQSPDSALGQELDYWGKRLVEKHGVMWITSASNASTGEEVTHLIVPAGFDWATVVTALGNTGLRIADYSNYGKTVDFCAPGRVLVMGLKKSWTYETGTSYAAPYLGSLALNIAQYMAEHGINANPKDMDVYNAMRVLAIDMGDKGYDMLYGYGKIDMGNLSKLLTAELPPAPEEPAEEPDEEEEAPVSMAQQFYEKARQCVGGLYVWGGQGHLATESYLKARAARYPQYFDGGRLEMMLARVKEDPTLHAWDCSGLVCWALAEMGAVESDFDTTAHGLYKNYCIEISAPKLTGDLMFRYSGGKMVHVGIYAPEACVEAAGGAYGVVECKGLTGANHVARSYVDGKTHQLPDWTHYGRLKMLAAEPTPEPTPLGTPIFAVCTGASVNVRSGPGTDHGVVVVAHKNDKFVARITENGWYLITGFVDGNLVTGYMSGKYISEA